MIYYFFLLNISLAGTQGDYYISTLAIFFSCFAFLQNRSLDQLLDRLPGLLTGLTSQNNVKVRETKLESLLLIPTNVVTACCESLVLFLRCGSIIKVGMPWYHL